MRAPRPHEPPLHSPVISVQATTRVTTISPGVTVSELGRDITVKDTAAAVDQLRSIALETNAVANAIHYSISQPVDVDVNEIILRTVRSTGHAF